MARILRPIAVTPASDAEPQPDGEHEGRASATRLRARTARDPATFLAWAQEQVTHTQNSAVSEEARNLESRLIAALRARDTAHALMLASALAYSYPDHDIARRIKTRCAQQMRGATMAFPRHDAIPRMRLSWHEIEGRNLSQKAAFMLSCIDGALTVEQLIDVSAMAPLVAYDTLDGLVRDGIIELT